MMPVPSSLRRSADGTAARPVVDGGTLRTRKRFARRQWARRWLAWKPVVAVLLLLALVVGTFWAVFFSSWLAVQGVEVAGASTLSATEVRAAAMIARRTEAKIAAAPRDDAIVVAGCRQLQRRAENASRSPAAWRRRHCYRRRAVFF